MKNLFTLLIAFAICSFLFAQEEGTSYSPVVSQSAHFDVSKPIRDIAIPPQGVYSHHLWKGKVVENQFKDKKMNNSDGALPVGDDPLWQKDYGTKGITPPIINFEGTRNSDNGTSSEWVSPPDTDGDVGPNHYFQMCNVIFQIFDKSGTSLLGPLDNSTIWDGFVGAWTGTNDGDPIILYDEQADRWLVSQFAVNTSNGTYWELVAISTTGDPTGSYYRYAFQFTSFPDYPKFGIWRDGYYIMVQHGTAAGNVTAASFNRTQMIAGNSTAQMVSFPMPNLPGGGFIGMLPSDNDGQWAPVGAPNYFMYFSDDAWGDDPVDRLKIWEFHVDWTTPALSTLTLTNNLNTTAFDSYFGSFSSGWITQPGTTQKLATMEGALMNRLQYRNFGSFQSMVCCHTIDVNGANRAGVRWYELRKTTGAWYIYQQGTYSPGATDNYWMASIAQNGNGDIALGFSVSSGSTYPSIRYTGRNYGDALGVMTLTEQSIYAGTVSQYGTHRWGDYTMMSIDPTDDKTFWYTNEYINSSAWSDWVTRIAAFSLGDYCGAGGGCDEYISNVQIGSINNSSGCNAYANYNDIYTTLYMGVPSTLTVTNGNPWSADQCGVWVDWNNDGDFVDANESMTVSGSPGIGPYTASVTPPVGSTPGAKTMRVRIAYNQTPQPCGTTTYGEVEDYGLYVNGTTNIWTGAYNYYWHNDNNWTLGHIPLSTEDVYITSDGYHPPNVDYYNEECKTLTINPGAGLNIAAYSLTVNQDINVYGNLTLNNTASVLRTYTNITWQAGATASATASATIYVQGVMEFANGANVQLNSGYVDFFGTGASYIRSKDADSWLYHVRNNKTGYELGLSAQSTQPCSLKGNLYIYSNALFSSYSLQPIIIGNFVNNLSGMIHLDNGTFVFDGSSGASNFLPGDYFNHLTISSTSTTTFSDDILVKGNLLIESGTLSPGATTITLNGDWTNSVGPAAFMEGTGRVIIAGGNYHQYCSSETFNILEVNKPLGGAFRMNGTNVVCAAYDWTAGAIDVLTGSFTANDLLDNGLFGAYYLNTGGTIDLINSGTGTYVDLRGELHIFGGTMNVSGSLSEWPYLGNAMLEMSGGVLDFKTCGIIVSTNAYTLNDAITGGIIRTAYGFSGNRADFTPTAGTFEFYGSGDAIISESNGCNIKNVVINKSADDGLSKQSNLLLKSAQERVDITMGKGSKANTISLGSNFMITGNLDIQAGTLNLSNYTCTVTGTTNIEGILAMTQAAADLTSTYVFWNSGSDDNVTAGTFHVSGQWAFNDGTNAKLGTGNTAYLEDLLYPTDADAEFGNLVVVPFTSAKENKSKAYYPIRVAGNFTIQTGAQWNFNGTVDLIVAGNSVIQNGGTLNFMNGADYYNTGTLDLSGDINLYSGSVATIHGDINFPSTGILIIYDGASFICDYNAVSGLTSLGGRIDMTGTALFEMTMRSVNITSTFNDNNILGGTMRFGRTLNAGVANNFQLNWGTVEFISNTGGHYVNVVNGNYLNQMKVDKLTASLQVYDNLIVKGDLTIVAGVLNSYDHLIYVGGDWTNNVGPVGFVEGVGTVYFNGTGALNHQFITGDETFYNIENAKSGGGYLRFVGNIDVTNNFLANGENIIDGPTLDINKLLLSTGIMGLTTGAPNVTVNSFTMGGTLSVTNGNFTCTDVTNNGIFGTITLYNGSITLFQDAGQYSDLNATLNINGGYMAVNNGNGGSLWGYSAPCSVTMTNGVLDFNNNGIYLASAYPFTENITGGTIKTNLAFSCDNTNFTPAGGTVELYGGTDSYISTTNSSNFFNLLINKSGGVKGSLPADVKSDEAADEYSFNKSSSEEVLDNENSDRPKMPVSESKANQISTSGVVKVNGTTTVEEGTFLVDNYVTTCMNNININAGGKLSIGDYGTLAIDNGKILSVNNGGFLDLTGSIGGAATITRNTGIYALNVESGGTIGAVYGVFEYMNTNGVNIKNGALVDVVKPFNNCTFRNGQAAGRLMSIENNQTFYVENAVFPANTWSGTYNVYKSVNAGMVYFVTSTGGFAGSAFEYDPNSRIFWTQRMLSLKAYLEGPFNGTNMSTALNGILPLSHPFNPTLPYFGNPLPEWRYTGAGSVAAIPNANIVDWVLVDLRDAVSAAAATSATSIAKFPAFILNNGNIVGLNGSSYIEFSNTVANNLFVVIFNRNHQSIMSASPVPYAAGNYTWDYSTGATQVYGGTAGHKQLASGIWGMRSGDGNGDGDVLLNDKTQVWGISTQLGKTGYLPSDFNFDRQTNNKDKNDKWVPNNNTYSQVPN